MWYYNKKANVFEQEQKYDESNMPVFVEYSDEAYKALFDCDDFHYVGKSPTTGLPVQLENIDLLRNADFWRKRRQRICFPIANRGNVWYKTLTENQANELFMWYKAWLDITVTFSEPAMPTWLK